MDKADSMGKLSKKLPTEPALVTYIVNYLSANLMATSIFHFDLRGSTLGSVR